MKKYLNTIISAALVFAAANAYAAPQKTVEIWDGVKMAGEAKPNKGKKTNDNNVWYSVQNPVLDLYLLKSDKPNGFVIVCPGGAYYALCIGHEGEKIAKFLNQKGYSAAVLKYRVPNNFDGALMDAQRAVRIARANAKAWNIKPDKIAIMGFSAGASLAARASTNYGKKLYAPVDDADRLSARPDATCLIYPAYCSQPEKDRRFKKGGAKDGDSYDARYKIADWNVVDKNTPPAFITQTQFDPYVDASIAYYLALKEAKVPAQLHMLPVGKHGYQDKKVFEMYADWLKSNGF